MRSQARAWRQFCLRPSTRAIRLALSSLLLGGMAQAWAQQAPNDGPQGQDKTLAEIKVSASADASVEGLSRPYTGGQVARGGRVGLLGNQDIMDTPFSTTSYTSELIQNQQAKSVADVLLNDPTVRATRGFGNFQEMYMVRGFPVPSDDMTFNGLYGMLPRQYLAAELIERVELLRGANAFLNGGTGGNSGFGIGGMVNVLPKRAGNEPLSQVTAGLENGGQGLAAADIARRFGPDQSTGLRLNVARRDGASTIKSENRQTSLLTLGADYRGRDARLSLDIGYQDFRMDAPRPSVTPDAGVPDAPSASANYAQPWTFAQERSTFATARAEFDLSVQTTAWIAAGMRNGDEENRLANPSSKANGTTSSSRFDNVRKDEVRTGEVGLRTKFRTGEVNHALALSAAAFQLESRNAYAMSSSFANNLYDTTVSAMPAATAFTGGVLGAPLMTARTRTSSVALADTLSFAQDNLRLTIGARQQRLDDTSYKYATGEFDTGYDKSRLTPMAGVVYKPQPGISVYANYIEGLTKGDTASSTNGGSAVTNAGQALAPYVAKQKEVGLKYDQQGLGAGVTLFSTAKPFGVYNASNTFVDGGEQRNQGLELSVFGEPQRGMRLLGGLTLLDARITSSQGGAQDGNLAPVAPSHQLNLGAETLVAGVPGLAFNARVVHTGGQYANAANTLGIPVWSRLDLGMRYVTGIGQQRLLTLRARLDNVADRAYWASSGGYPGQSYLVQGAPRTLSVSASVDF